MPMNDDQQLRADPADRRDVAARRGRLGPALAAGAVLLLAAALALWWWTRSSVAPPPPVQPSAAPAAQAPASAPPAPVVAGPRYPLPPAEDDQPLAPPGIAESLADLLGRKAVDSLLLTQDFPRRFVATVDSLARDHAPPAAWPVAPTPGRFSVEERPDGAVIAATNAARYAPLVQLATTMDAARAVRLYRRMYPLLQQSYRELGFGDRHFNDRVVEVIDLLLATPEPREAPRVRLTEVKGPVPSVQPWTRYEFVDPALESLAAGQKILVRVGPLQERRLKDKLRELRALLVQGAQAPAGAR